MKNLVEPSVVSNYLLCECRERGEILTNLKLQKLLFYAQAWHLALKNTSLFEEDFQAWVHGPVLPSQYQRFKDFKWRAIDVEIDKPELPEDLRDFLDEIIDTFGTETAISLELMTHREKPWKEARGNLPPDEASNAIITKQIMTDFYKALSKSQVY